MNKDTKEIKYVGKLKGNKLPSIAFGAWRYVIPEFRELQKKMAELIKIVNQLIERDKQYIEKTRHNSNFL